MYLLERGIRLTGADGWSWDAPFKYTAEKYRDTGDATLIWEGHKAGRDIGILLVVEFTAASVPRYCHINRTLCGQGEMCAELVLSRGAMRLIKERLLEF